MAGYPYYSPPPPPPPCNDTTPTLPSPPPPPPPPPACMCNKTTPTSPPPPPPPSTRYSPPLHSRPPPSHSPPPSPACNETTPTVSPPTFPSLSPPPPPQHLPPPTSPYYSPPQPSLSRPPLSRPPSPPSPPPPCSPPSPSPTPPPRSFSPPPPPPRSIAPSPYPPHKLPPSSPPLPSVPPPCHCVCPSPWAPPPNYHPSIAPPPNYYPSVAPNYHHSISPSPQFLSPSNGHRTVVLTTFVSLGGVFFLAFITIGLLSMAMKKKMRMPTTGQGHDHTFESTPASTSAAQSVINIDPPYQGAGHVVKEGEILQQTMSQEPLSNQSVPHKISADPDGEPQTFEEAKDDSAQGMDQESIGADQEKVDDLNKKLGKPLSYQNVADNLDAPPDTDYEPNDEEKSDEHNRNTTQDVEQESNAEKGEPDNTTQDAEKGSYAAEDESSNPKNKLRPRKKNNGRKGKQGGRKSSTLVDQARKAATNFVLDGEEECQDDDNDEEESQDVEQESNEDQGGPDKTTQDAEKESNAVEDESKKRLVPRKKNNGRNGMQAGRKSSTVVDQAMKAETNFDPDEEEESQDDDNDEEESQDVEQESYADQGGPDNTTQDVEKESNAAEGESKKRSLPRKKNNGRNGKQGGRKSSTFVDQAMMAATNVDPDEEEESQDVEQKFNADQGEPDSTTQDVENESNAADDESKKRLHPGKKNNGRKGKQGGRKSATLVDQAMMATTNFDPDEEEESQDDDNDEEESQDVEQKFNEDQGEPDSITQDVENESNAADDESKNRLLPRKKNNGRKGKQGGRKSSTLVDQAMKATTNFDPDGEKEFQDDDNDDEEVYDCPLDVEQESFAIKDESNDSKALLRHRKKTSNACKGKQGEKQSSKLGQVRKATINFDPDGEEEYQDDENDDPEVQEVPQEAEDESNANEEESDDRNHKPVGNQTETDNIDVAQDVEQESSAVEKESKNLKERLHPDKISPSSGLKGKQGERKSSTLVGQAMKAAVNVHLVGALQGQDYDNDEAEEKKSYRRRNELPNLGQTVTVISGDNPGKEFKSFGNPDDKEEESEAYSSNQNLHRHKRHTSTQGRKESSNFVKKFSATIGANQGEVVKSLNVDQILTAPVGGGDPRLADDKEKEENDDSINECDDPSMECESFVDDNAKKEESKAFGSKKVLHLQKRQTGAQRRKKAPDVGQTSTSPIGGDIGVDLKSFADDYAKEENEDPSIECDDPNMEYELRVDDDAKEEKSDSFGSKKDSRLHKRQIGARGRRDPRNVGQIWSDPLGGDPSTCSLADDDEKEEKEDQGMECDDLSMEFESLVDDGAKEEESESFCLKKVTFLQKRQIGGRGSKGPPNVGKILNIPTGGDAGEDLKFLADEQKKLELFDRKEVSPLHKHQAGASGRKEPPNLGQILIATTGNDPGLGLKSVATQGWASNIGESMTVRREDDPYGELESHDDDGEGDLSVTATNEGDTNAGLEFHEEDEELESECSNKGLGLHKSHALFLGEIEPSTDDQSVFVTGDDDPDESGEVARSGKPLSRPRTTGVREKRRT